MVSAVFVAADAVHERLWIIVLKRTLDQMLPLDREHGADPAVFGGPVPKHPLSARLDVCVILVDIFLHNGGTK